MAAREQDPSTAPGLRTLTHSNRFGLQPRLPLPRSGRAPAHVPYPPRGSYRSCPSQQVLSPSSRHGPYSECTASLPMVILECLRSARRTHCLWRPGLLTSAPCIPTRSSFTPNLRHYREHSRGLSEGPQLVLSHDTVHVRFYAHCALLWCLCPSYWASRSVHQTCQLSEWVLGHDRHVLPGSQRCFDDVSVGQHQLRHHSLTGH